MKKLLFILLAAFCFSAVSVEAKIEKQSFTIEKCTDMKYLEQNELISMMSERDLEDLTDNLEGQERTDLLEKVNKQAVSEIEGYLRGRYDISQSSINEPLLTTLTVDLMKYRLYRRRDDINIPDVIITLYKSSVSQLKDIASGKIKLNLSPPNSEQTNTSATGNQIIVASRFKPTRYTL